VLPRPRARAQRSRVPRRRVHRVRARRPPRAAGAHPARAPRPAALRRPGRDPAHGLRRRRRRGDRPARGRGRRAARRLELRLPGEGCDRRLRGLGAPQGSAGPREDRRGLPNSGRPSRRRPGDGQDPRRLRRRPAPRGPRPRRGGRRRRDADRPLPNAARGLPGRGRLEPDRAGGPRRHDPGLRQRWDPRSRGFRENARRNRLRLRHGRPRSAGRSVDLLGRARDRLRRGPLPPRLPRRAPPREPGES